MTCSKIHQDGKAIFQDLAATGTIFSVGPSRTRSVHSRKKKGIIEVTSQTPTLEKPRTPHQRKYKIDKIGDIVEPRVTAQESLFSTLSQTSAD